MSTSPGGPTRRSPAAIMQPSLQVAPGDNTTNPRMPRRTHPRTGFASGYAPHGRRRLWAAAARCPRCGHTSLHKAPTLVALDGSYRSGSCGHWYKLKIKGVYPAAARQKDAA